MEHGQDSHSLMDRLVQGRNDLTPKGRLLADYVQANPRKAVFMTTRELAVTCETSEATVVRFVGQLGYDGYPQFIQALRDHLDAEMTLLDRVDLAEATAADRLQRVVFEEIDNLKHLYESLDREAVDRLARMIIDTEAVYCVGSRLSHVLASYMGWSLTKIRGRVRILEGSDSTTIDWLTIAPAGSLVIMFATSRYPNELIRLAKLVRRLGHTLAVVSDSRLCPINRFGDLTLVAPSRHFPVVGSPSTMTCLVNCLTVELLGRGGGAVRSHQEKLESVYRENDILFNLDEAG